MSASRAGLKEAVPSASGAAGFFCCGDAAFFAAGFGGRVFANEEKRAPPPGCGFAAGWGFVAGLAPGGAGAGPAMACGR